MRLVKKWLCSLLLIVILLMTFFNPVSPSQASPSTLRTETEVLGMVQENSHYLKYKDELISEIPKLVKQTTDGVNGTGYIIQYDLKYRYQEQGMGKFSSLLSFVYSQNTNELNVAIIDYSGVMENDEVYVLDLEKGERELAFSVIDNQTIQALKNKVKNEVNSMLAKKESNNQSNLYVPDHCYVCTKTEYHPSDLSGDCSGLIGTACKIGTKNIFVKMACQAGIYVFCYVPAYTICVEGRWSNVCEKET